jgi:23S rRNA (uracil1939-C5)-methyltransferase
MPPPRLAAADHDSLGEAELRPAIGRRLKLPVSGMALEGDAIVHHGRYVLFVSGAIPGEEVEVEVESAGRKHGRARLLQVLRPSPHRVAPPCPYFGPCGGCAWQHIDYAEQLRLKERMLASALELALGMPVPVGPAVGLTPSAASGGSSPWGFRNKVHFVVGPGAGGELALGHYGVRSRNFIPVEECRVHAESGNRVALQIRDLLRRHRVPPVEGDRPGVGTARHLLARAAERSGEVQAVLVATKRKFPGLEEIAREATAGPGGATGFHLNINRREGNLVLGSFTRRMAGRERLLEEVAGVRFLVSPLSFFQTSTRAAEKLVELVISAVPSGGREPVLDLYAGVGLFALPLAKRGQRVLAVEENPYAVADGIETARLNRIRGCQFQEGRVEEALRRIARRGSYGTVILDPPRDGASSRVLWEVARTVRPARIIYVSCDPRALARDLGAPPRRRLPPGGGAAGGHVPAHAAHRIGGAAPALRAPDRAGRAARRGAPSRTAGCRTPRGRTAESPEGASSTQPKETLMSHALLAIFALLAPEGADRYTVSAGPAAEDVRFALSRLSFPTRPASRRRRSRPPRGRPCPPRWSARAGSCGSPGCSMS